jgi:hypothetical protein
MMSNTTRRGSAAPASDADRKITDVRSGSTTDGKSSTQKDTIRAGGKVYIHIRDGRLVVSDKAEAK